MKINKEDLKEAMEKFNEIKDNDEKVEEMKKIFEGYKEKYKDKNEEEVLEEIEKFKDKIDMDEIKKKLKKHKKTIKKLEGMLNEEQKERLKKVMDLLDKS